MLNLYFLFVTFSLNLKLLKISSLNLDQYFCDWKYPKKSIILFHKDYKDTDFIGNYKFVIKCMEI